MFEKNKIRVPAPYCCKESLEKLVETVTIPSTPPSAVTLVLLQ